MTNPPPAYSIGIVIGIAYFTVLRGQPLRQTAGKHPLGIRVIDFSAGGSIG